MENTTKDCKMVSYAEKQILENFESAGLDNPYNFWLNFNSGYFYPANSKITLYADETRWAMVFELHGVDANDIVISTELFYFGNCLINMRRVGLNNQFISNYKKIILADTSELESVADYFYLKPSAESLKIENKDIPIVHDLSSYTKRKNDIM